jgi:4-aminobutyrate aminotransferase/(S)-3-amino-2-methylpropionate transaminase
MNLPARAEGIGEKLWGRALRWQKTHPLIGDVRGLGAMVALEFVKDRETTKPDKEFTVKLVQRCVENGVLLIYAGTHSNVLRYLVPLIATDEQLYEGLDLIEKQLFA